MTHVLAAEGGYQEFTLGGGEWLILIGSALTALLAIARRLLRSCGACSPRTRARRRCRRSPRRSRKARWPT